MKVSAHAGHDGNVHSTHAQSETVTFDTKPSLHLARRSHPSCLNLPWLRIEIYQFDWLRKGDGGHLETYAFTLTIQLMLHLYSHPFLICSTCTTALKSRSSPFIILDVFCTCLYHIFRSIFCTMDRTAEFGLEVEIAAGPEVVVQPYTKKYNTTSGSTTQPYSSHTDTSVHSHRKSQSHIKNVRILAIIGFICLAVAIGAGLGVGLAAQHKSSSSK